MTLFHTVIGYYQGMDKREGRNGDSLTKDMQGAVATTIAANILEASLGPDQSTRRPTLRQLE